MGNELASRFIVCFAGVVEERLMNSSLLLLCSSAGVCSAVWLGKANIITHETQKP